MTRLSVNLNKIALLRNSRGRNYPDVAHCARRFIELGVHGITLHPRPDERHATRQDTHELGRLLEGYPEVEFNVEGYPSEDFLRMVEQVRPDQCTLVPDDEHQLTSDHGWDVAACAGQLTECLDRLARAGIRSSVFLDPDPAQVEAVARTGADRIELYTEHYASCFGGEQAEQAWEDYRRTAAAAQAAGLGVNAGHDLDLRNLARFLEIGNILEVSIGHALTVECIERGMAAVVADYLDICA